MNLPILSDTESLCEQCVALCCRYYAFAIETPKTHRDFEDIRWFMLHEDTIVFVDEGEWYIQVNRKCKALLPDNRCGIYENRPSICREYTTKECDWHGEEYDYDHLFTDPQQIQEFAKEYLARKRKRRAAARRRQASNGARTKGRTTRPSSGTNGRSKGRIAPAGGASGARRSGTSRRRLARKGIGDVPLRKSA